MRLRSFLIATGTLLIIGGLVASISLMVISTYLRSTTDAMEVSIESIHSAEQVKGSLLSHNRTSYLLAITHNPRYHEAQLRHRDKLLNWSFDSDRFINNEREHELALNIQEKINRYLQIRSQQELAGSDPAKIYIDMSSPVEEALTLINELIDLNVKDARNMSREARRQDHFADYLGISSSILLIGMFIVIVTSTFWLIYRPLKALRDSIGRFVAGDFNHRASMTGPLEFQEVSRAFNDMVETIARQRQSQYRFLASVAHDLKNPLSAISMSAQHLSSEESLNPEEEREMAAIIVRQTEHLESMVNDLLDASQIEAGNISLDVREADLKQIISDSVKLYESLSPRHHVTVDFPDFRVSGCFDPVRIMQVINNLLSNAIKYSPYGGRVQVGVTVNEHIAQIKVTDEGMGIPSDELDRIFEPFSRSSKSRDAIPGVGLGLSACKRIIEAHGGSIRVESQINKGSTFTAQLPLKAPQHLALTV